MKKTFNKLLKSQMTEQDCPICTEIYPPHKSSICKDCGFRICHKCFCSLSNDKCPQCRKECLIVIGKLEDIIIRDESNDLLELYYIENGDFDFGDFDGFELNDIVHKTNYSVAKIPEHYNSDKQFMLIIGETITGKTLTCCCKTKQNKKCSKQATYFDIDTFDIYCGTHRKVYNLQNIININDTIRHFVNNR